MSRGRSTAIATALLCAALAVAGCGLGPGEEVGEVELAVTRDFGAVPVLQRSLRANESDTVMRLLEGSAAIETSYGGGFVQAIEGIEASREGGSLRDWFFYIDGVESPIGAAEYELEGGERIWWDYRDWSAANRVPAVVGSWPAPFVGGYEGERHPVAVECRGGGAACAQVRAALAGAGVEVAAGKGLNGEQGTEFSSPAGAIRVLVGPWARLRSDPAAALLEAGVEESGVFATFERRGGGHALVGLDRLGEEARRFGPRAGLVAATRRYEAPPTWLVTGATAAGVREAAGSLAAAKLRDHYAVASEGGIDTPLPVGAGE